MRREGESTPRREPPYHSRPALGALAVLFVFRCRRVHCPDSVSYSRSRCDDNTYRLGKTIVYVNGTYVYKKPKTESSIRDVKLPSFVVGALREQRKRTWKGDGENFVFVNKEGRHLHRHTLNRTVIGPALEKIKMATHISAGDTRAFYITNAVKSLNYSLRRLLKALGAIAIYFRKDSLGRFDIAMLLGHDPFGEFSFSGFCGSDEVSVEHLAARRNCKHKNTRFMRSASL